MKTIFESSLFSDNCYNPELGYPYTKINERTIIRSSNKESLSFKEKYSKFLVILDNGHGCNTPGKSSPDKSLKEYAYARKVVKSLSEYLDHLGIQNIILVSEEEDIDLKERARRANIVYDRYKSEKTIFLISVHNNACGDGTYWKGARGWTGYTSKGTTEADVIAKHFYAAAEQLLGPKVIRKYDGDKNPDFEENFYILAKTKCPALLTENFFMDNKFDCEYLLSEEGFQDVLDIHINGIVSYIEEKLEK